jgi:hypothetical protein
MSGFADSEALINVLKDCTAVIAKFKESSVLDCASLKLR